MTPLPDRTTTAPSSEEWRKFLSRALIFLAASSLLASAVCFIAYNWGHMGPSFKLGLTEALLLVLAILSWRLGHKDWPGQLAVFCAAFLVGPLLAIYGQAYPTGAPLSDLLFTWACITAVVALLVQTEGLWLLSLVVLNTAFFYWNVFSNWDLIFFGGRSTRFIALGGVDLAAFALTYILPNWLPSNSSRRLLVFSGAFFLNIAFVWDVVEHWSKTFGSAFYLFLAVVPTLAFLAFKKRDLFILVVSVLGMFSIGNTLFLRAVDLGTEVMLLLTVMNLIAGSVAAYLLNQFHQDWKASK